MKPYSLFIALTICSGCYASSTVKTPSHNNRVDDCNDVYQRVLGLTFDQQVDPQHEYGGDKREYGIHLLNEQFVESGARQKFYKFCINKMSEEQIACVKTVTTVEGMDTCNQLIPKG